MYAVITGSRGFLGQYLVKRLQHEGIELISLTHEILANGPDVKAIFLNYRPIIVYNLQAYGNHNAQDDDYEALRSNIIFTHHLARIARESGVKYFVQFGSSSEYGTKSQPMKETDSLEPTTMYGATKAAATWILRSLSTSTFRIVVVRPFSVYGPGEADFRLIPTIINKLSTREVLNLDSNAAHDWIYIDDFIDGLMAVTTAITKEPLGIVNIGTGIQYTNRDIYGFISKIMRKKTRIKEARLRPFDTSSWVADNTKLKSLGWLPKHDIISGLQHTVAHYVR